jgi:hypothetical protein
MAEALKPIAAEVTLTTANNISDASLVRTINLDASNAALITLKSNTGTVLGTFTLGHSGTSYGVEYIVKLPTDTIQANNAAGDGAYAGAGIKACSVAYR